MTQANPFEHPGQWFKANFHTHSTVSDGNASLQERVRQYRDRGYQVLAITDHGATSDVGGYSTDDFLLLSGTETHPACPDGGPLYHLVCLNVPLNLTLPDDSDANERIRITREAGGEVIVAHPYWCGHTIEHIAPLHGYVGLEVFNATCSKIGKAISSVHWDDILDRDIMVGGSACDDTHGGRDIFMGWTMLKMTALTAGNVMEALRTGCYYASCGPTVRDLQMTDGKVRIECSPAAEVHFMCSRHRGWSLYADDADPIEVAEYVPAADSKYVRVEVVDERGRRAWTNPILVVPV